MTSLCLRKFMAILLGCLLTPMVALAAPVKFEIPAQPAPAALQAFIKQSGVQVVFNTEELQSVPAKEVRGAFEPADALAALLQGTGFAAAQREGGIYVVKKLNSPTTPTGSVKGALAGEGGKGLAGVLVTIRGTDQSAATDKRGQYVFPKVAAGTYVLVATAPGYQPLHIVEVEVTAGRELTLGRETLRKPAGEVMSLEPFVVHSDAVTELENFEVRGTKQKPYSSWNVDLPRTVDDVQPYYIFDSKTIDQSGAINVETFLKQRLTMNTTAISNVQSIAGAAGNTSSVNLRGLGTTETLILVNGRRTAGINTLGVESQPDLNGIPLGAIDRIEVLPSSASGIYGGSAIGGVVNVILKKDYAGGEFRATYDNTFDTNSPTRTVSASYGFSLEGGKTHVMLNGSWSDAQPMLLQDRRALFEHNLAVIEENSPGFIASGTTPFLGALPNISPATATQTTLTLKNGTALNSPNTHIAAGTSASTPTADLYASLLANAGTWNMDLPASTQANTGLLRPFGATPETKSLMAKVRRQMLPTLEFFADFSAAENRTASAYNYQSSYLAVPINSPVNPFTTAVRVRVPDAAAVPITTLSATKNLTVGAIAQLPWEWTGEFDYSWSESRFKYDYYYFDNTGRTADLKSGVLNPFVDTLLHPLDLAKYLVPMKWAGLSNLNDIALRASGPLKSLPWGAPNLTLGLEHRIAATPQNTYQVTYPITSASSFIRTFFSRQQVTDSAYGELSLPVVKSDWLPFVHTLELQASARTERYAVDTGSPYSTYQAAEKRGVSGGGVFEPVILTTGAGLRRSLPRRVRRGPRVLAASSQGAGTLRPRRASRPRR